MLLPIAFLIRHDKDKIVRLKKRQYSIDLFDRENHWLELFNSANTMPTGTFLSILTLERMLEYTGLSNDWTFKPHFGFFPFDLTCTALSEDQLHTFIFLN